MKNTLPVLMALFAAPAFAQDADAVRGGWMADVGGVRHIYMLTVRGTAVTGAYCTDCSDVANLALIRNGVLAADGLEFEVVNPGPAAYRDTVTAKLVGDWTRGHAAAPGRRRSPDEGGVAPHHLETRRAAAAASGRRAAAVRVRAAGSGRAAHACQGGGPVAIRRGAGQAAFHVQAKRLGAVRPRVRSVR